jgi:hypothetical protein
MADNLNSKDKALETLDFIINVLKEHEQNLDGSIGELETVTEHAGKIDKMNGKIEGLEKEINSLQKDIASLSGILSNSPKETFAASVNKQEPQAAPMVSPAAQGGSCIVLQCKEWLDFQTLSMNAQTLTFNIKDDEKTFQANALKGNQIIMYSGQLPMLSSIMISWLSQRLEVPKHNIMEGALSLV